MAHTSEDFDKCLEKVTAHISGRHHNLSNLDVIPTPEAVQNTISSLPAHLPAKGLGTESTTDYLINTLLPGCLQAQNGPRYFGFVTGGVTPAAQLADILGGSYDENVQVTLPGITASTAIEQRTLEIVLDLIDLPRERFGGRTITTGATASNVLGLACARDHLYANSSHIPDGYSYSQNGPLSSPNLPSPPIRLLALHPHYSILKAAALVGIGSGPNVVHSIPAAEDDELAFDLTALEAKLLEEKAVGRGVVLCYGLGEVNTGGFGRNLEDVAGLCRKYGAWLHIDAAFGGFAAILPELQHLTRGMELADSLTLDGHKWLNVPYDCGLFYTRSPTALTGIFAPPTASAPAYLASGTSSASKQDRSSTEIIPELVPSPLFVNIENSRKFRALPLFASLLSLGREGYSDIIRRNIAFAQSISAYLDSSPNYELLNHTPPSSWPLSAGEKPIIPLNIVLFRGSPNSPLPDAVELTKAINDTRKMYVTGAKWRGVSCIRLAVSNWRTGIGGEEELGIVKEVFEQVMQGLP